MQVHLVKLIWDCAIAILGVDFGENDFVMVLIPQIVYINGGRYVRSK